MSILSTFKPARVAALIAVLTLAACSTMMKGDGIKVSLSGSQEVPANKSMASGSGTIVIGPDKSVSGSVTVTGMTATAAHIHLASAGKNGPVVVPFIKSGENTFAPAANAKLTDTQYESFKAGDLYVNVHSAAFPGGEVRGQLKP